MTTRSTSTFITGESWDETPDGTSDGPPTLAHVVAAKTYTGDIDAEASGHFVLFRRTDGSATVLRLEQVVGRVGDRSGSFVLEHSGVDADGVTRMTAVIVPGSATGDLLGLTGRGACEARSELVQFDFEYGLG